jgi:protein SCO1/2
MILPRIFVFLIFTANLVWCSASLTPNWEKISGTTLPDITFTDTDGNSIHLSDYNDKTLILQPMFTHCPSTCLFVSSRLSSAVKDLSPKERTSLRILSFSFDPEETPQSLQKFRKTFQVNPSIWKVVRADAVNTGRLLKALDFRTMQINSRNYDHANLVFVIGKDRVVREYIFGSEIDFQRLSKSIRSAENDHGSFVSMKSYIYVIAGIGLLIAGFIAVHHITTNNG